MNDKIFTTGLVVGKFAPLHNGHALVIECALGQCEQVVVISYSNPEFEDFPPLLRDRWIADCFPDAIRLVVTDKLLSDWFRGQESRITVPRNDAPDIVHREFVALLCARVLGQTIDAVFTSESYGDGFADLLTRRFAECGLASKAVTHVEVDRTRTVVPISGTLLRADRWAYWQHLPGPVATSLVRRVALLGGESSGKSTLAAHLARDLDTVSVPEYGRELWENKAGDLEFDDMPRIASEQIRREDAAVAQARGFVFCDTSPLTTLFYSLELFGGADLDLLVAANRHYDLTVLCVPDFPYVQDGTRRDAAFTARQQAWYERELKARGISYIQVAGSLEARTQAVRSALFAT